MRDTSLDIELIGTPTNNPMHAWERRSRADLKGTINRRRPVIGGVERSATGVRSWTVCDGPQPFANYRNGDQDLFHYTNDKGYKAISSQVVWLFKASKSPCGHSKAAYFTTLPPGTKNLSKRLFVRGCAEKTKFVFNFSGGEDLLQLRGGRGDHVHYSVEDYPVEKPRQGPHGETEKVKEQLE